MGVITQDYFPLVADRRLNIPEYLMILGNATPNAFKTYESTLAVPECRTEGTSMCLFLSYEGFTSTHSIARAENRIPM